MSPPRKPDTPPRTWTCPSCGRGRTGRFCPQCGEERLRPRDLTVSDLAVRFAENVSSVDGKLFRSFRSILAAPGVLTAAHIRGQRRPFLGPLALFFIANGVFVLLQSLLDMHTLSSPLDSHLHDQDWSGVAQAMVAQRLRLHGETLTAYSAVFDQAVTFNAKALMILMVAAFVPLPTLLFRGTNRGLGVHVVFALHLYAVVLALLCVSLLLAGAQQMMGGEGLRSPAVDLVLSVLNLAACAAYIYLALGPAYHSSGPQRIAKTAALALAVGAIFVAYRFAIFAITLYTT
jgi:hypothetical protein